MSFIFEAVGHIIKRNMQDPKELEKYWNAHIDRVDEGRKKVKAAIDMPVKPFGFWTSDKANAKFNTNQDLSSSRLPGRAKSQDE